MRELLVRHRLRGLILAVGVAILLGSDSAAFGQRSPAELAAGADAVLRKYCFDCHGKNPKKPKGDLNLFDRSHLLNKERGIVIADKPDESGLLQKIVEGEMPPGKRPKPPETEQRLLRDWIAAGAPAVSLPVRDKRNGASRAKDATLAGRVKELLRSRCFECHGGSKTNAGIQVLDYPLLLAKKKIIPGKAEESRLFQLLAARDESVMPPAGQPRLSSDDIELVRRWLVEGAVAFPEDVARPNEKGKDPAFKDVVGVAYVHQKILDHVRSLAPEDRRYVRYFSVNHLLTGGVTRQQLELHRDALIKALNHLSWETALVRPQVIDAPVNSLFAVDIRQLGWHKQPFHQVQGRQAIGRGKWNLFDLVLLEYPYAVLYEDSETFDYLVEEFLRPAGQVRPIVYVRADWFVSTATQPPLYEGLLQLPFELKQLEDRLGIDADANLNGYIARRAGMTISGVSRNNRVVERHPSKYGAYWKSYDFRSSKGEENIFQDPIHLYPAGGEMIFNLPNGLQGYLLANNKGVRIESAPTEIVTDKFAEDKTVRNGLACMRCHDQGMKRFLDTVRPAMLRLPGSAGLDKRQVLRLYPEQAEMDRSVNEDTERFMSAMQAVLGKPQVQEPLVSVTQRFLEAPLQLSAAGAELGLAEPKGLKEFFRLPRFAALGLLPLSGEGVVRRDTWEDYYDQVVRDLGLGIPLVPLDGLTRRDYRADPSLEVELRTNKKGNVFEPGDELVIYVKNYTKKDVYIELIGTSARGEKVILPLASNRVGAGQEYRFPPVGGLKIRPGVGKEEITLFASDVEMPAGQLLRGKGVSDRVLHLWYELPPEGKRKIKYLDPTRLVKRTIELETR